MSTTSTNILESDEHLDSDQNDQPKDYKSLISFYFLGVCNVYLFLLIMEFGIFGEYHQLLFYPAIPFAIIKMSPLFISTYLK